MEMDLPWGVPGKAMTSFLLLAAQTLKVLIFEQAHLFAGRVDKEIKFLEDHLQF